MKTRTVCLRMLGMPGAPQDGRWLTIPRDRLVTAVLAEPLPSGVEPVSVTPLPPSAMRLREVEMVPTGDWEQGDTWLDWAEVWVPKERLFMWQALHHPEVLA